MNHEEFSDNDELVDVENIDEINNYKGIYYQEDTEQKFFEADAHFSYVDLCRRLEKIVLKISPERRGKTMYEDWPPSSQSK